MKDPSRITTAEDLPVALLSLPGEFASRTKLAVGRKRSQALFANEGETRS